MKVSFTIPTNKADLKAMKESVASGIKSVRTQHEARRAWNEAQAAQREEFITRYMAHMKSMED